MNDFGRHGLIMSDAKDYSSRNEVDQHELQQTIVDVYEEAAHLAMLDRAGWTVQPGGDGELAVLPRNQLMTRVIDEFPKALREVLAVHNSSARPAMRLRMRLALHEGLVRSAAGGYAGTGVVTVSRMVDSPIARQALAECPEADLVVLVSQTLYNEYVQQGHTVAPPGVFREVAISVKTYSDHAWLLVPGHDVHALKLDVPAEPGEPTSSEPTPPPAPTPAGSAAFNTSGVFNAREIVIGQSFRSS